MFYVSTTRWLGIIQPREFIGLANYTRLLTNPHFHSALINTGIYLLVALPIIQFVSFMLGFFLSQRLPGYRIFRTIFFSPGMLSAPALAMMFLGCFLPDGIINYLLREIGLGNLTRVWLADPSTSLFSVMSIDLWRGIGYNAVLFFAFLSNLPKELYDAARIDGASNWIIMWRIAFPLSLDFFGVLTMLLFIWIIMGAGQNVLLLTKGGPGDSSLILGYYLYEQAFVLFRLGYSQAIGVFIFIIGMIGMLVIKRVTRRTF
jgi:multiple sugar transport system permease protein